MAACVPAVMDEGKPQDQAVAQCMQMWRDRDKAAQGADRAWSVLTIKAIQDHQRVIEGVASTPSVDRVGDIVEPLGAKFTLPMPLLWQHRHEEPVGHVTAAKATKDGITIKAKFAKIEEPGELKNMVDKAWQAVKAGLVRGLSIGFKPTEWSFLGDGDGIRYSAWQWFELSLVTVPAQQEAQISVIKSLDADHLGAASGPSKGALSPSRPGASGNPRSNPVKLKERAAMSTETVTERISAFEAKRAANLARMNALSEEAGKKGETLADDAAGEYDELEREIEVIDKQLERERKLEKFNLSQAKPVVASETKTLADGAAARGGYVRVKAPELPKGVRLARVIKCLGLAEGQKWAAAQIAEKLYGDDQGVVNILKAAAMGAGLSDTAITKASVMGGTTIDPTWAGALVGDETSVFADFVEWLRPMTILGKFGTNGIPGLRRVPFRTALITQTSGMTGYWVGEGQPKPLTSAAFSRTTMEPLKAANIAVVTEELLRDSSPSAETLLRDELAAAIAERLDTDFIDPAKTAVAGISPASITNGVSAISSSGVTADHVRADVAALTDPFIAADNPPNTAVWIMSASTALRLSLMTNALGQSEFPTVSMSGGTFAGMPVIVSEYVPTSGGSPNTRYVVLANASDIYLADEGGVAVDMSREASVQMLDNPTNAVVGPGGSPLGAPVATTVTSFWQTNSVGFRAERTINWMKRRTSSVQLLSGVVWGT